MVLFEKNTGQRPATGFGGIPHRARPDEKRGLGNTPSQSDGFAVPCRLVCKGNALKKKGSGGIPPARDEISLHFIKKNISQKCFLKKLMIFFGNVKEKQ